MSDEALDKALDDALLKISKEHGISIPKDDYVLIQFYLNKEIIAEVFKGKIKALENENKKSKDYFREALAIIAKRKNKKKATNTRLERLIVINIISTSFAIVLFISMFTLQFTP